MAEFYGNGLNSTGSRWCSSESPPKEKSLLEKSLDEIQRKADDVLSEALELAKSGNERDRDKIKERIEVYHQLTSISPDGFDEQRVENVQKHFKYSVLVSKFQKRLKKRIFS